MRTRSLLLFALFAGLVVAHPRVRAGAEEGDDDPPPAIPMPDDIPTECPPSEDPPVENLPSEFPVEEESPKITQLCDGIASLAKLDCQLLFIRKDVSLESTFEEACTAHAPLAFVDGSLECVLGVTEIDDDLIAACALNNLVVVDSYGAHGWNSVTVRCQSISDLEPLAARDDVLVIHPQSRGTTNIVTQGDAAMRASNARATFGLTGNGVRVGVLSASVWRPSQGGSLVTTGPLGDIVTGTVEQTNGELPTPVNVLKGQAGNISNSSALLEGAAMLEIVHDVAPGAALSFATGVTSKTDFERNIRGLAADPAGPCDIIADDITFFDEPIYQDGPIALAIDDVVSQGVAYFTAAGNWGNTAHEAVYTDVNPSASETVHPPTGVDLHDFGAAKGLASQQFLQINGGGNIVLKWDEPYSGGGAGWGSAVDLDLYVLNAPAMLPQNIVARSVTIQGTGINGRLGDPFEIINFDPFSVPLANQNPLGNYYVCIDHVGGRTSGLRLHLLLNGPGPTASSAQYMGDWTVYGHALSGSACTVAATHWGEVAPPHNVFTPADPLPNAFNVEPFSSVGAARIPLVYGGFPLMRYPPSLLQPFRKKPDVCGPDGGQTTVPGFQNFSGTSAATPHVAAVAALLMQQRSYADWGPELYATLVSTAVDMETPGWDTRSGAGFVDALNATQSTTIVKVPLQYPTIQAGINAATTAGTYVVVSTGTYMENISFGGRNVRLTSTDPRSSSIVNGTKIDGRSLNPVVTLSGTESPTCLVTGFRIQHGKTLTGAGVDGGGISGNRCTATIRRNVIRDNKSTFRGGGLANCDGTIRRNTITTNSADLEGGGLSSCSGTIEDNVIDDNDAGWLGGGLAYCYGFVHRNSIQGNTAQLYGGGLARCGGTVQDNEIADNTAKYTGGGLDDCDGTIADNRIHDNESTRSDGGGLQGCDGTIARNVILNNQSRNGANTTGGNGGGLAFCQGRIHNNVIARNRTRSNKNGGGLYQCNGDIQFDTIFGNSSAAGDGMHSCGITPSPTVPWLMANCIVWGNGTATTAQVVSCGAFTFCDVQNWTGGGFGNINANPQFVNTAIDDYSLGKTPRQPVTSPCINAGQNLAAIPSSLWCDVLRFPRPPFGFSFGRPDMGAVEHP